MPVTVRDIRTQPGGPLIQTRVRPIQLTRANLQKCFRLLVRWNHGPTQGRWSVVSSSGFTVVCVSRLQAEEAVLMIGGKHFPRPAKLCVIDNDDERRYTEWLLRHYFRIDSMTGETVGPFDEEGCCRRPPQVLWSSVIRGWYPNAEDILETATLAADMLAPTLRRAWQDL